MIMTLGSVNKCYSQVVLVIKVVMAIALLCC